MTNQDGTVQVSGNGKLKPLEDRLNEILCRVIDLEHVMADSWYGKPKMRAEMDGQNHTLMIHAGQLKEIKDQLQPRKEGK